MRVLFRLAALSAAAVAAFGQLVLAQSASAQPADPSFTAAQAEQGADLYRKTCAQCHGDHLNDGQFGPALKGGNFKTQWGGKSLGALFDYVKTTMPPGQAGLMTDEEYVSVLALMLQSNGVAAGASALPADPKALSALIAPK